MADVREEIQKIAEEAWVSSGRKNTLIASVGSGKSRIALNIIKRFDYASILLLTNATVLRDVNWKDEFDKFGMSEYWGRVESQTYQAMYNKEWKDYDLIIQDEIDFAASPLYQQCFQQALNHGGNVLGLTGFATEDKRDIINQYFPICYEVSTEEMQGDQLLNKSEFIFVEFPLLRDRNIQKKNSKTGAIFYSSENSEYEYWDKEFQKAMAVKSSIEKKYRLLFIDYESQPEWKKADFNFKIKATKRKGVLMNLNSSIRVVGELLSKIYQNPDNKVLIFSALQSQCNKFPNSYHGAKQEATLDDLNAGRVNTLSVVKKITRGVNLVGVNYLIRESYDGSEEMFQQTHGRLLRLKPDQIAKYIILVPLFETMVRKPDGRFEKALLPTQAAHWAEKMTRSFNVKNPRYIRLDSDYKLKDGIQI